MTPEEIRALREKHRQIEHRWSDDPKGWQLCAFCSDTDFVGRITPYPCDVIKVLDAWEAERATLANGRWRFYTENGIQMPTVGKWADDENVVTETDEEIVVTENPRQASQAAPTESPSSTCDHIKTFKETVWCGSEPFKREVQLSNCPKCGEKL